MLWEEAKRGDGFLGYIEIDIYTQKKKKNQEPVQLATQYTSLSGPNLERADGARSEITDAETRAVTSKVEGVGFETRIVAGKETKGFVMAHENHRCPRCIYRLLLSVVKSIVFPQITCCECLVLNLDVCSDTMVGNEYDERCLWRSKKKSNNRRDDRRAKKDVVHG
ncbi:unnamed protein product [Microthlaspi erraticum]|uniref:Uncharacterized protein n=1 Tax=Microthlaspi erraticum TaxID=1685480 RepID=A0A6D2LJ59_9BRAS|nr:unnamed protein product [Microthlaspi erraticum]